MRSAEENKLEKDLRRWFSKLQRKIQKLIDTYYEDELFFLHVNKVYTIVEDMKPEYQAILLKHGLTQFYNARETATTLYTIQQKKVSAKASLYEPQIIRQEDVGLFRTNPQIEDSLRYSTFQASDTTLARVSQNITNNLSDSYHEGLGINDAGRRITKEFSSLKGWESRRIARTEINSAQNEGAFTVYDELGVEYHMWWTGQDNRVRDSHAPLHGHIVAVGNTFSNGLLFPGDKSGPIKEWINCRCTTLPYIIPLGKMAPPGLTEFTEDQLIDIPGYRPVTVEDALKGEYPLEYYTERGVIDQYKLRNSLHNSLDENKYEALKTVEDVANFFGYEIEEHPRESFVEIWEETFGENVFCLYDKKHNCRLVFGKGESLPEWIDITNSGKGEIDFKEIIKIYNEAPKILKECTNEIIFRPKFRHKGALANTDFDSLEVNIYGEALLRTPYAPRRFPEINSRREGFDHNLYHEMGHSFDAKVTLAKRKGLQISDVSVLELSHSPQWKKARELDHKFQKELGFPEFDTTTYGGEELSEDFAEMCAIVSNYKNGKRYYCTSTIKIPDMNSPSGYSRRARTMEEIKKHNPNRWKLMEEYLGMYQNKSVPEYELRLSPNVKPKEIKSKKSLIINNGKIKFTEKELEDFGDLNSRRDSLKFLERKRLKKYEEQLEFNYLYNIYGDKLPKNNKAAKRYYELAGKEEITGKLGKTREEFFKTEKINTLKTDKYTEDIKNPKNIKKFSGTTKDGSLPTGEPIENYFNKNVSNTPKYDEIIDKWVYEVAYKDIQYFDEVGRNKSKLRKRIKQDNRGYSKKQIDEEFEKIIRNVELLDELMKNAKTTRNIRFMRAETKLHISDEDLKRGKTTISSYRSFSISPEGVEHYRGDSKSYIWTTILEAPVGINSVYIAPKARRKGPRNYVRQMEAIIGPNTECDIVCVDYEHHTVVLRAIVN